MCRTHQKLLHNLMLGLVDQRGIFHGKGWEPDDAEEPCIHLLGAGLPGEEGFQFGLGMK